MNESVKVPNMNLDPYPRIIFVEVDRKRSDARNALRNPPSSSMRGSRRKQFWKDSNE
jgi:hypothetical protein